MKTTVHVQRSIARFAILAGYCLAKARASAQAASAGLSRGCIRTVEAEGVRLFVPAAWGQLERDSLGRLVLYNRPKCHRIDGDAVWYSLAVELRILPGRHLKWRNAEAMTTARRYIATLRGPVTLELVIANGVGPRQRAAAEKVLKTAAPVRPWFRLWKPDKMKDNQRGD